MFDDHHLAATCGQTAVLVALDPEPALAACTPASLHHVVIVGEAPGGRLIVRADEGLFALRAGDHAIEAVRVGPALAFAVHPNVRAIIGITDTAVVVHDDRSPYRTTQTWPVAPPLWPHPGWSPPTAVLSAGGRHVAIRVAHESSSELVVVDLKAGTTRRYETQHIGEIAWSEDGQSLMFTHQSANWDHSQPSSLSAWNVATGERHRITLRGTSPWPIARRRCSSCRPTVRTSIVSIS